MTPDVKATPVNGTRLYYIEQGSGEPVVLVHGSLGDYRSWKPQMEGLSPRYRVIAYSRRYHYPADFDGHASDYTVGRHADDLAALVEALGIAPAAIIGNSFGAFTTLMAARRHPEIARKIVIGEPPILPWLPEIEGGQALYDGFLRDTWNPATAAFQRGEPEEGVRRFIDWVSGEPVFDRIPPASLARRMENAAALEAETRSSGIFTPYTREDARQITTPTLLLTGERSPRMFHLIIGELERVMPNARHVEIPKASHSIPSGNPEVYNETVLAFLRE